MIDSEVDVYPVGFMFDILYYYRAFKHKGIRLMPSLKRIFRAEVLFRKSYWNGFLAEPYNFPAGLRTCGHGWTKKRAMKKLNYYSKTRNVGVEYV
jgi:hypothetical protein